MAEGRLSYTPVLGVCYHTSGGFRWGHAACPQPPQAGLGDRDSHGSGQVESVEQVSQAVGLASVGSQVIGLASQLLPIGGHR